MAGTGRAGAKTEDIAAEVARIREDVATLTRLLGELAGARVDGARGPATDEAAIARARESAGAVRDRAENAVHAIEAHIAEKPVQSALIALAAGLVIGLLTRR